MKRRTFLKQTGALSLSLTLSDLAFASDKDLTDKPSQISTDIGQSDYPSICKSPDGIIWAVWQNYTEGNEFDTLQISSCKNNKWSKPFQIPQVKGDIYKPACQIDKKGNLVVIWSEQNNNDWYLWQIKYDGRKWSNKKKLFPKKGNDFAQKVIRKPNGDLAMTWQGFGENSFDIFFSEQVDGKWTDPKKISGEGNDWFPDICIDNKGTITVAWDSYRLGKYDIYLRQYKNGKWNDEFLVSANEQFEANVKLAAYNDSGIWIAYEQRGKNWGKDFGNHYGYEMSKAERKAKPEGSLLIGPSRIKIRFFKNGKLYSAPSPSDAFDDDRVTERGSGERTRSIHVDESGLTWVVLHKGIGHWTKYRDMKLFDISYKSFALCFDGSQWTKPMAFNETFTRLDSDVASVLIPDQGLISVSHNDNFHKSKFKFASSHDSRIFSVKLPAPVVKVVTPKLKPLPPASSEMSQFAKTQKQFVGRARNYLSDNSGKNYHLCRGDLHRHTNMSYDGRRDGSIYDLFRYSMDAAGLDFAAVTDHSQPPGLEVEYIWWKTQKITDLFNVEPHFTALFGYERSVVFPQGHRNIIEAERGHKPFPDSGVQYKEDKEKTSELHSYIRKTGGITIPHTSATVGGGTDWTGFDEEVDTVIELYQGARYSSECEGAPRTQPFSNERRFSSSCMQTEGYAVNALKKGHHFGFIASSDHSSIHMSYANVFTSERTRQGILNAMKKRHTFASTDDIIIDFNLDQNIQGDIVEINNEPEFKINISGTAPIRELVVIKNGHMVHRTQSPDSNNLKFTWKDDEFKYTMDNGESFYYVRIVQEDGEVAWSSPIWCKHF